MDENFDKSIFKIESYSEDIDKFKDLHERTFKCVTGVGDPLRTDEDFLYLVLTVCLQAANCHTDDCKDEKFKHYMNKMLSNYGLNDEGGE